TDVSAELPLIVLVEDDARLAQLVRSFLDSNGFRVVVEDRGDRVVDCVERERPALVILDLGLPGQDGLAACHALRARQDVPILILTARNSDVDQIHGLELGADDYVIKPVVPQVLVARIQALLRRRSGAIVEKKTLTFGALTINTAARSVIFNAQE